LLQQELTEADTRLNQFGPAPAAGQPAENETIAAERKRLGERRSNIDAALKQARLLSVRVDTLIDRITESRRNLFTSRLFVRTSSAFDPVFWEQTAQAVPGQWRALIFLFRSWAGYAFETGGASSIAGALLTLVILFAATIGALRWIRERDIRPLVAGTRFSNAFYSLIALIRIAASAPLMVVAVLLVLDSFSLMRPQIMEIGLGLVGAIAIASFGRGVAIGLFAPREPDRRLPRLDDARADLLSDHLIAAARILGVIVFINVLHRATAAPVASTVATSALLATLLLVVQVHLLLRLGRAEGIAEARGQWMRGPAWIVVGVAAVALATGYIGFAAFLTARILVMLAALG